MVRKASSLTSNTVVVDREFDTESYDTIKVVSDNIATVISLESAISSIAADTLQSTENLTQMALDTAATAADRVQTGLDRVVTTSDKAATNADVVTTNADVVTTTSNVDITNADVIATQADSTQTALDAIATANDKVATNADVVTTNANVVTTNSDVATTNADVILVEADKVQTGLDRIATNADVVSAEADKVQTGLDRVAVASDLVSTNTNAQTTAENKDQTWLDRAATGIDRAATDANVVTTTTNVATTASNVVLVEADKVQTGLDRIATNADAVTTNANVVLVEADKVQTGLDRSAVANDLVLTNADVVLAEADKVQTGLDRSAVAADLLLTNADVVLAEADKVQTGLDRVATNADVVTTNADVVLAEADKVQTGLDRIATNADVVLAEADKVQTGLDRIATATDLVLTNDDVVSTNADVVLTGLDVVASNADVVSTGLDVDTTNSNATLTNADVVTTGLDVAATAADKIATDNNVSATASDVVATNANVVLVEADKVQTGLDRIATGSDVTTTNANTVLSEADKVQTALDRIATASDLVLTNADVLLTHADVVTTGSDRAAIAALYDNFDDRFLGTKTSDPTLDNDGQTLLIGAMYFNSTSNTSRFYNGGAWEVPQVTATTAATTATSQAVIATTKAGEAATSATDSANSATSSSGSATAASNSVSLATTLATNAANSATASALSASEASASETNLGVSETNAAASASAAASSESTAGTHATTATTKASEASTSASEAATTALAVTASVTASANSASASAASATTATTKASEADASAISAAAALTVFTDQYTSSEVEPSSPELGNQWFDESVSIMKVYNGSSFVNSGSTVNGVENSVEHVATAGQTTFAATYDVGYLQVFLNMGRLASSDYTATDGTSVTLALGATLNDIVFVQSFSAFQLADHYSKIAADARYAQPVNHYTKTATDLLLDGKVDGSQVLTNVPSGALFTDTDTIYSKPASEPVAYIDGLQAALDDKYSEAETDSKIIELSPPATKSHVESLGILANTITGALPAIDGSALINLPAGLPDQTGQSGKSLTTDGTSASWTNPASEVTMHSFEYLGVAAQTVISGVDLDGNTLSYTPGSMRLYMDNGQLSTSEYTATDGTTITMVTPLIGDEELVAVAFDSFVVADHYSKAEADMLLSTKLPLAGGTLTGDISHGDNVKSKFGAGDDLQIYHDPTYGHSHIVESGTGNLKVQANNIYIKNADDSANYIHAQNGAEVALFYDNSQKFATTSTGIDVTGTVNAAGLVTTGNVGIGTSSPALPLHIYNTAAQGDSYARIETAKTTGGRSSGLALTTTDGSIYIKNREGELRVSMPAIGDAMAIDSSGNVGIGVVPETSNKSGDIHGEWGTIGGWANNISVNNNAYYNSGWKYKNTAAASQYTGQVGKHVFQVAPSGTADSAISWTTAMTIDNSGSVLVGKTTDTQVGAGHVMFGSGAAYSSREGFTWLHNRLNSDGEILLFQKDGTTVGSIGTANARLSIGGTDTGIMFKDSADNIIPWNTGTNGSRDGAISLGEAGGRFKDLHLSGTVNTGGLVTTGSVGIGTSSPTQKLTVGGNIQSTGQFYAGSAGAATPDYSFASDTSLGMFRIPGALGFATGGVERMRIDSSGHIYIGNGGAWAAGANVCLIENNGLIDISRNTTSSSHALAFYNPNGQVGGIVVGGSSTSYNTSSDYRLKTNVTPMTGATERVKALRPINFAWKVDGSLVDGFLAHELAEVVPEAATGTKDAMMDEEYEVSAAIGDVFTAGVEGVTAVYETVTVSAAIEAQDAVMSERNVTETIETGSYVNLAGETIVETQEKTVTTEVVETEVQRQDIDGVSTEVEVEVTKKVPVTESYESTPAVVAVDEVTEQSLVSEGVTDIAEVIHSADVEQPETLEEGQQWRETTEQVMATRSVPDMQGIDQAKLVPLLTATIQELIARIEALEA